MIFFVLNLAFATIIFLFYPETSGRTLEGIDDIFMGENDRLFVVSKTGKLLPGFRSQYKRTVQAENENHDVGAKS